MLRTPTEYHLNNNEKNQALEFIIPEHLYVNESSLQLAQNRILKPPIAILFTYSFIPQQPYGFQK